MVGQGINRSSEAAKNWVLRAGRICADDYGLVSEINVIELARDSSRAIV